MKKNLLLIALPALMILSSCSRAGLAIAQKEVNFKEDTLAHSEIFGGQEEAVDLRVRKMSNEDDFVEPKIGVQYRPKYEKVADSGEWFVALRFIAAVGTLDVDATWTRDIYKADGTKNKATVNRETTKAYESLYGGAGVGMISAMDEIKEGTVDETPYNYYVAYTIYDIPFDTVNDYYIVAHLTISDPAGVHADGYSKAMAARIGGGATAKFDKDKTGFFLAGKIGGAVGCVDADETTRGGNAASFTSNFVDDDRFMVIQKAADTFKVWGGSCLGDGNEDIANVNSMVEINSSAKYVIYLNTSDGIYHTKYGVATNFYIRGTAGAGWGNGEGDIGIADTYRFVTDPDNKAILLGVTLSVGDFKISDQSWSHSWGYKQCKDGGDFWKPNGETGIIIGGAKDNFEEGESDDNIHCKTAGTYNIYLTNNWYVSFELAA